MTGNSQKIIPFLACKGNAEDMMNFYVSVFPQAHIVSLEHFKEEQRGEAGTVLNGILEVGGQQLMFMDMEETADRPDFSWSMSLYVPCTDEVEFDKIFAGLSEDGLVMIGPEPVMEFRKVVWITDKFGVTWQPVWK